MTRITTLQHFASFKDLLSFISLLGHHDETARIVRVVVIPKRGRIEFYSANSAEPELEIRPTPFHRDDIAHFLLQLGWFEESEIEILERIKSEPLVGLLRRTTNMDLAAQYRR